MPTTIEERSRITARIPIKMRSTLEQAAELVGSTVNQFVVQSAYEEAQRILERETVIRLSQADAQCVFALMENPAKPNKRLTEAVKKFRKSVRE
jgi:uncharacterized protein (DUF1778 family)